MARHEDIAQARQTVAVIGGTGALGFGLARALGDRGRADRDRLARRRARRGGRRQGAPSARARPAPRTSQVEGLENEEAAKRASTVVLAVPFRAQSENLNNLRYALAAADDAGRRDRAAGSRDRRPRDPHARRVAGLGGAAGGGDGAARRDASCRRCTRVSAAALSDPSTAMDEDVLMAGDDRKAKDDVAELIRRIPGLRPVDCGDLEMARILEQLTPLLISVNKRHKIKHSGVRITGLTTSSA